MDTSLYLRQASARGAASTVAVLINRGANINEVGRVFDDDRYCALGIAALHGHLDVVKVLLPKQQLRERNCCIKIVSNFWRAL